jgi:2-polyprenyl-3-methyl-5-hydroxy-6-metoxy-1,4-benzoquinol methylase
MSIGQQPAEPLPVISPNRDIGASYDGSTATYRLMRAFEWGPTFMNLGYCPFRFPLRMLNWNCDFAVAQRRLAGKSIGLLQMQDGLAVLDVACGRGASSYSIARMYPTSRVVGIDYLPENIALAQALFPDAPKLEYRQGDAMKLAFPAGSFDRVHCLEAAFHFPYKRTFLAECARVLRPGGLLVLVDIVWRSAVHRLRSSDEHAKTLKQVWQYDDLFAREEYLEAADAVGFDVTEEHDWSRQVLSPLVTRMRLAVWLARRPWGRRLLERINPQLHALSDGDWRELERSAEAHRGQQPLGMYFAMVARRR